MTEQHCLDGMRVILGVTGGIACYKACELARALGRAGARVQVVMTEAATAFVTPLTFQALTGNPVRTSLLDPAAEAGMGHIELARWADLLVVAPCTANTLANLAHGQAPDLLSTLWLATGARKAVAPAMNQAMWADPSTAQNIQTLQSRGVLIIGPASGPQACGDTGFGRMMEPSEIIDALTEACAPGALQGRSVVITAGPTHEAIDPVRYLANRSSGKMGYALASAAAGAGAKVTLISGPTALETPPGVYRVSVESAMDMAAAVAEALAQPVDMFIGAAAVSDMRPKTAGQNKLKKGQADLTRLELVENPDIIATVAGHANRPACVIGFAAETERLLDHARAKCAAKGLDAIIANDVSDGKVFGQDVTHCYLVTPCGQPTHHQGTKTAVSQQLIDTIARWPAVKETHGTSI